MLQLPAALRVVTGQHFAGTLQLPLPIAQFLLQRGRSGIGLQTLGPGLVRSGLGRKLQALPGSQGLVGLLQVLQQHPPRHAVHHQVMDDQQQPLATVRQRTEHGTHQWTVLKIEAALGFTGGLLQLLDTGEIAMPKQLGVTRIGKLGLPIRPMAEHAQA
ncbi:hypothetical protein D3C77_507090 [compost metagenome]